MQQRMQTVFFELITCKSGRELNEKMDAPVVSMRCPLKAETAGSPPCKVNIYTSEAR